MEYGIAARPTLYRGVQFRSRLEANWAAFFDSVQWYWTYEPFDCCGWVPDFAISSKDRIGKPTRPVLVEVKPVEVFPDEVAEKIDAAEMEHEVLILGHNLLNHEGRLVLGWLRDEAGIWAPSPLGVWRGTESEAKNPAGTVGFCHWVDSYQDRITGCYDGGSWGDGQFDAESLRLAWGSAKNAVQWNKPDPHQPANLERMKANLALTPEAFARRVEASLPRSREPQAKPRPWWR